MPSIRSPSKVTVPERGRSAPAIDFSSVDLPAPLAPATQTISPLATSIDDAGDRDQPLIGGGDFMHRQHDDLPDRR